MVALRDSSVLAVQPAAKAKQKTAVQGDFIGDSPNSRYVGRSILLKSHIGPGLDFVVQGLSGGRIPVFKCKWLE